MCLSWDRHGGLWTIFWVARFSAATVTLEIHTKHHTGETWHSSFFHPLPWFRFVFLNHQLHLILSCFWTSDFASYFLHAIHAASAFKRWFNASPFFLSSYFGYPPPPQQSHWSISLRLRCLKLLWVNVFPQPSSPSALLVVNASNGLYLLLFVKTTLQRSQVSHALSTIP